MGAEKIALSARDLEETLSVARHAFDCDRVDELQREVLQLLEKIFKSDRSNFFLNTSPEQHINLNHVVNRGIEERFLEKFRHYYYRMDPFLKVSPSCSGPSVLTTDQVVSFGQLVRGEYYNDFLRPQHIHYQMTIWLQRERRMLGTLALFRPRSAANFSPSDRAKALMMAPHLAGALDRAMLAEQNAVCESIIKSIVPQLPYKGIVVLDRSLEPVYQNRNALGLLPCLPALPKEVYLFCKDLFSRERGSTEEDPPNRFESVSSSDGQALFIWLRLIGERDKPLILLGIDSNDRLNVLHKRLRDKGLSRREIEVVFLLSKGLRNHEIGEKLFISSHTVDNHLKSIYRKLGVNNRTAAAGRLHDLAELRR